ncbi:MAG: hypothetical protein A2166_03445 [Omnitrophica WOR_2 bacterium RBG_13_41_10]|nr:MAG: hypothetical protein A2166_03445 [Omnitrophica WOR_2 bacterium RBG_13_41_10]
MDKRILNEKKHGKKIINVSGKVWGWESSAGQERWQRRVRMLTSHIEGGMRVLEIGCGTGELTKMFQNNNSRILSIDVSFDLIGIAKRKVKSDKVTFLLQDASNLGFAENSFDTIIGSSVLHHLEVDKALKEFYRVLRPGGSIFLTEPNMMNPQIVIQKNIPFIKKLSGDSPNETAFLRWSLKKKLEKIGFKDIELKNFDFLHPAIPKVMIPVVRYLGSFMESLPIIREVAGSIYIKARK